MTPREKVIAGLGESLMVLFRLDSMAAVLRASATGKVAEYQIDHYAATMQSLLVPTYEALQDAIALLEEKGPAPADCEGGAP